MKNLKNQRRKKQFKKPKEHKKQMVQKLKVKSKFRIFRQKRNHDNNNFFPILITFVLSKDHIIFS